MICESPEVATLGPYTPVDPNKIFEQRRPGKLVKRTAGEVSVRQIQIADDRYAARVENICWSACIDGLKEERNY